MRNDSKDGVCLGGSLKAEGLGDGLLRGEGILPLRVAGVPPAVRGQDALDTEEQGQDGLATQGRSRPRHGPTIPKLRLRLPPFLLIVTESMN